VKIVVLVVAMLLMAGCHIESPAEKVAKECKAAGGKMTDRKEFPYSALCVAPDGHVIDIQ